MDWILPLAASFFCGAILGPLVEPWSVAVRKAGRRIEDRPPCDIHVESDQAVIWAGHPPWLSFACYVPGDVPDERPPEDGRDWPAWATQAGGYDLGLTMLRVTIVADRDVTVVLDQPVVQQAVEPVPQGTGFLRPAAGGAEISPRRFNVDLGAGPNPLVIFHQRGTRQTGRPAPSWTLGKGDVEQFHIWATADDDLLHEWTLVLPVLVDGKRLMYDVTAERGGQPFKLVGWRYSDSGAWKPGDPWPPPASA